MTVEIVIFAALGWEVEPVLAAMHRARAAPFSGLRSWVGSAGGRGLRVVRTGVGKERARAAAALACDPSNPRCFLSTGCAGALHPDLSAGDLVVATRTMDQDGSVAGSGGEAGVRALASWAARNGVVLHGGPFCSVDRPLLTPANKSAVRRAHGAIAVEMEGAAIATVAAAHGVRFVAVRSILDAAAVSIPAAALDRERERGGEQPGQPRDSCASAWLLPARRTAAAALRAFFNVLVEDGGMDVLAGA